MKATFWPLAFLAGNALAAPGNFAAGYGEKPASYGSKPVKAPSAPYYSYSSAKNSSAVWGPTATGGGNGGSPGPDTTVTVITSIYTTVCPATKTWVSSGTTSLSTYITTSTITESHTSLITAPPAPAYTASQTEVSPNYSGSPPETTVTELTTIYTTVCPATTTGVRQGTTIARTYETTSTVTSVWTATLTLSHPAPTGYSPSESKPFSWSSSPEWKSPGTTTTTEITTVYVSVGAVTTTKPQGGSSVTSVYETSSTVTKVITSTITLGEGSGPSGYVPGQSTHLSSAAGGNGGGSPPETSITTVTTTWTTVYPTTTTSVGQGSTLTTTYQTTEYVTSIFTSVCTGEHSTFWTTVPWGSTWFSYTIPATKATSTASAPESASSSIGSVESSSTSISSPPTIPPYPTGTQSTVPYPTGSGKPLPSGSTPISSKSSAKSSGSAKPVSSGSTSTSSKSTFKPSGSGTPSVSVPSSSSSTVKPSVPIPGSSSVKPTGSVKPSVPVSGSSSSKPSVPISGSSSVKPSGSTKPSAPVSGSPSVKPSGSVKPSVPVSGSPSVKPSGSVKPSVSASGSASTKPSGSVKPSGSGKPSAPVSSAKPSVPVSGSPSVKPSGSVKSSGSIKHSSSVKPSGSVSGSPSVKPSGSAKPSSVKPSSVVPSSVKPSSVKPSSVKPTSVKPSSIKPSSIKPSSIKPSSVKPSSIKPSGTGSIRPTGSSFPAPSGTISKSVSSSSTSTSTCSKPTATPYEYCTPCEGQPGSDPTKFCGYTITDNWYDVMPITCRTVEYHFTVTNQTVSPDGVERVGLVINGQLPGPKIEANWGDTIIVHYTNGLENNGTSLHFHGMRQNYTNEMDGVPSITQCALAPGESITYTFKASNYGSSWYHSHFALQTYDGVFGPMVIHGPAALSYDEEESVVIQDWSHVSANAMYEAAQTVGNAPDHGPRTLDTGLINGLNIWGTDGAANVTGERWTMNVVQGKRYRLRLVNTAIQSTFKFYIDGHTFQVISNDFVPIQPYETQIVNINIGQRYDLIFTADQPVGNYWMRADNQNACATIVAWDNIKAIVSYAGADVATPTSTAYNYTGECVDEPLASLVPIVPLNAGNTADESIAETVVIGPGSANPNLYKWTLSGTTFQSQWGDPTLSNIYNNGTVPDYSGSLAIEVPNLGEWVYVIIDSPIPLPHPIHLHGHDFFILAQGTGLYDSSVVLNTVNPPRRDVALMPFAPPGDGGHLVLAFQTDNPGVWLMHCHIGWHTSMGFALQIIEAKDEIKKTVQDSCQLDDTCSSWHSYASANNITVDDSGV